MCSRAGTATVYGQDGPGIESRRQDFPRPSTPALGPTQPRVQLVLLLSRGKCGRGVALTIQPHLAPRLKKEYCAMCSLEPRTLVLCYEINDRRWVNLSTPPPSPLLYPT